jgi:hypothetical protein
MFLSGIRTNESEDELINVMFFENAAHGFNRGKRVENNPFLPP